MLPRLGPNEISICNVDAIQPVLGAMGLPKGPGTLLYVVNLILAHQPFPAAWDNRHPVGESRPLVEERDPAEHQKRRRPWNRAFSSSSLKNYEPMVLDRCRELVAQLAMRQGEVVDVVTWMRSLAYVYSSCAIIIFLSHARRLDSTSWEAWCKFRPIRLYEFRSLCTMPGLIPTLVSRKAGGTRRVFGPSSKWAYGAHLLSLYTNNKFYRFELSAGAVLSHIPWAIPTLRFIHPNDTLSEKMVALAVKWVGERIQRGSTRKDLFYHLVSVPSGSNLAVAHCIHCTDGRGSYSVRTAIDG